MSYTLKLDLTEHQRSALITHLRSGLEQADREGLTGTPFPAALGEVLEQVTGHAEALAEAQRHAAEERRKVQERMETRFGRDKVCERSACTVKGPADHAAKAHLDPRDRERFDGNETAMRATTYRVREAVQALHYATRGNPEVAPLVDAAIHDTLEEIFRLGQQVAAAQVDKDRQVSRATERAVSCEAHGEMITGLTNQAVLLSESGERSEAARLVLLGFLTAVDDVTQAFRESRVSLSGPAQLIEALEKASKKTHAAHTRKWSAR